MKVFTRRIAALRPPCSMHSIAHYVIFQSDEPPLPVTGTATGLLAMGRNKAKLRKVAHKKRREEARMRGWIAFALITLMPGLGAAAEVELKDQQKLGWRLYETS